MAKKDRRPINRTLQAYTMRWANAEEQVLADQRLPWQWLLTLPYTADAGPCRKQTLDEENAAISILGAFPKSNPPGEKGILVGRFRYLVDNNVPMKTNDQEESEDLDLADDVSLDYWTHFGWWDLSHCPNLPDFPNVSPMGVLIWENNRSAGSVKRFRDYLESLLKIKVLIEPLVDPKVWDRLAECQSLGAIRVRMGTGDDPSNLPLLVRLGGLSPRSTEVLELQFRRRTKNKFTNEEGLASLRQLSALPDLEALTVEVPGGQTLDLLHGKFRYLAKGLVPAAHGALALNDVHRHIRKFWESIREPVAGICGRRWRADSGDLEATADLADPKVKLRRKPEAEAVGGNAGAGASMDGAHAGGSNGGGKAGDKAKRSRGRR